MAHESAAETEFVMPCFLVSEWRREERNGPRRGDLTRDFHFTSAYISHHSVRSFCLWTLPPRLCRDFLMTVPCLSRVNDRNWRLVGVVNNLKSIKAVHVFYLVVVVVFLSSLLLVREIWWLFAVLSGLNVVIGNRFFNYYYCRNWIFFFVLLFFLFLLFLLVLLFFWWLFPEIEKIYAFWELRKSPEKVK